MSYKAYCKINERLLTPPDTPLFPSLDDEPPAASVGRIGRPQSQISLSRSSTVFISNTDGLQSNLAAFFLTHCAEYVDGEETP